MDDQDIDLPDGIDRPAPLPQPRASVAAKAPRAASDSVRRSDAWLAAQVARAVARGQRVL